MNERPHNTSYSKYITHRIALFCVSQAVMTANAAIAEDKMVKIYSCKKDATLKFFEAGRNIAAATM